MPVREQEFDVIESAVARAKWIMQQFAQSEMPYYEPTLVSTLNNLRHGQERLFDDFDPTEAIFLEELSITAAVDLIISLPGEVNVGPTTVLNINQDTR